MHVPKSKALWNLKQTLFVCRSTMKIKFILYLQSKRNTWLALSKILQHLGSHDCFSTSRFCQYLIAYKALHRCCGFCEYYLLVLAFLAFDLGKFVFIRVFH